MPETTYTIEYAKSGRSKCKKCKEPIQKGEMRLGIVVPKRSEDGFDMTSYHHVECFRLPKKFVSGPSQVTPEEFFLEIVSDLTEGDILPKKADELATQLGSNVGGSGSGGGGGSGSKRKSSKGDVDSSTLMGKLKLALMEEEGGSERPAKKMKLASGESFSKLLDLYKTYHKTKSDDLKDYLRWNRQVLMGNKDFILFKVLDGFLHGRLGFCGLCGGRLKFQEGDEDHVYCMGRFDEEINIRQPCGFKGDRLNVPRLLPWYTEEPTDEEKEEMDKAAEEARDDDGAGGGGGGGGSKKDNPQAQKLLKAAAKFNWKLNDKTGIQNATKELVALVEGKLDLPSTKSAKMALGPLIVANKNKSPEEIMQAVIDKYGFAQQKEQRAAAKEAALEALCENPKNAALLMVFQELSQYYFKEGNRNAGAAYTKVVNAIKGLKLEVTAANAMSLCKGSTKVPGIGKSSAEKMREFMQTGKIEKLEEKRADHS